MFYNNAICDIYIGKSAGTKLLQDIRMAKSSVRIVSPYLSPFLIRELINLHSRGIKIQLITMDKIEDFNYGYEKNIYKLIIQNKKVDEIAKKARENLKSWSRTLFFVMMCLGIGLFFLIYLLKQTEIAFGFIIVGLIFFVRIIITNQIKNKRIYHYFYKQLFPFKVFVSPNHENSFKGDFIHSKIYVIDNEVAYIGSLNFTENGIKKSHETRIRTIDSNAVSKIVEEVNHLFFHSDMVEKDLQNWGKRLYQEPIN